MKTPPISFVPSLDNPLFISAVFSLFLLAIYVIYTTTFASASKKRRTVLLLGTLDSGKTAILSTLLFKQTPQTHTSLQSNISVLSIPVDAESSKHTTPYSIVDIPGHPRLRTIYVSHLPQTHTILFVVDTSIIARSTSPGSATLVAEYIHQVLYQLSLISEEAARKGGSFARRNGIKLVIVAHKVDLVNTGSGLGVGGNPASKGEIGINRVRTILERELTKRANDLKISVGIEGLGSEDRDSKSRPEAGIIDSSSGHTGLECTNKPGEGFKFAAWEYGEIEFVSSYVNTREEEFDDEDANAKDLSRKRDVASEADGLSDLKQWFDENLV